MDVLPNLLEFKGDFTKPTTEYLTLSNTTDSPLAFKVKTTAPKLYCVRPNASIVKPGSEVKISIILQGFTQELPKDYKCKDKFLLVSLPCPDLEDSSKVSEVWSELENKYKLQMSSKKLRVNYIITGENDSSANGHDVGDSSASNVIPPTAAGAVSGSQIDKSNGSSELQKELDASTAKINNLSQKLDSNERADGATSSTSSTPKSEEVGSAVSLPYAFILILLAFFVGYLIF